MLYDDSQGGLNDVQDRHRVVFAVTGAATFMDPELSGDEAAELARAVALGPDRFAWYQVNNAVWNFRNQGTKLAEIVDRRVLIRTRQSHPR